MRGIRQDQSGYVALLAVLIVGAATVAIATTVLMLGVDAQRSTLVEQTSTQARTMADACAEEALQVVHDNTSTTGTNTITLNGSTCTYTITNTGSTTRTIDAASTINSVVRKVKVYVTIGSSISITSWQEVG